MPEDGANTVTIYWFGQQPRQEPVICSMALLTCQASLKGDISQQHALAYTISLSLPSSSTEVSLPPAIISLPALPVVNSDALASDGIQEALAGSILAVALELEGKTLEATVVPGAVALPVVSHGGRGRGSHESCDSCEGELHVEGCDLKDVFKVIERLLMRWFGCC